MSSHEYRNLHNKTKRNTKIERIVQEILQKNNISYVSHHRLDNYEFDIYLPELNILIECDGDYWHGKNLDDSELNESQSNTRKNDNIKNYIAVVNKIKLLRFWESDIKNTNFDEILLKTIWER